MAPGIEHLALLILTPAMAYACWRDLKEHRIPNWLCGLLVLSGFVVHGVLKGWSGLGESLSGAACGFGLLIALWLIHAMGAGDVKYMAGVGAWLGPEMTFHAVIAGILVGGAISVGMIVYQRTWSRFASNMGLMLVKLSSARTAFGEFASANQFSGNGKASVPYAIPLTLGVWGVLLFSQIGWWKVW
ncbi:MAG TPA: A24 family peptidase [Phycisphaerae bacterium]|nr:A24 family peptidase [Phycisphaerae bacterium]HRW52160.1 A24 family peptidase [Phycisphaerae bacterium]